MAAAKQKHRKISFFLKEYPDGDITLESSDPMDDPLIVLRFSPKAQTFFHGYQLDVARMMMKAGLVAFGRLTEKLTDSALSGASMIESQPVSLDEEWGQQGDGEEGRGDEELASYEEVPDIHKVNSETVH